MNQEKTVPEIRTEMFDNPIIRLQYINYEHGFVPESKKELNEVFTLIGYSTQTGKAAKHLNDILRHQINNGVEEPIRAVRSVASKYVSYFFSANQSIDDYKKISRELNLVDGHQRMSSREKIKPLWPSIVRLVDLDLILSQSNLPGSDEIHTYNGTDYLHPENKDVAEKIYQTMRSTKVSKARRLAKIAIETQNRRRLFWLEICKQSMDHYGARPIVREALNEFGKIEHARRELSREYEDVEVSAE